MKILSNLQLQLVISKGVKPKQDISIYPGTNEVSEEDWSIISKNELFKCFLNSGKIIKNELKTTQGA